MKIKNSLILLFLFVAVAGLAGCAGEAKQTDGSDLMSPMIQKADMIEVVHFHGSQRCYSCVTVGKYALKTIQERFPKEVESGTIVFRDINGELPENHDLVVKYQARGTSFFVNAITNGRDQIEEDVTVWRMVSSEKAFMDYFEKKLKDLLG